MKYRFNIKSTNYVFAYFEANRGSGKTLLLTAFCKEYSESYPKNKIYANFYLNLPNFEYIPDCFLPHSKLEKCLIAFDDSHLLKGMDELITTIENTTRKMEIFIFLVGHDKTDFLPRIRQNAEYKIIPKIYCIKCGFNDFEQPNKENNQAFLCKSCKSENSDKIEFVMINRSGQNFQFKIENPLMKLVKYYDTKQVVKRPTMRNMIEIIKRNSKSIDDLEINISILTKSQSKRMKLFRELSIELGFLDKNTNFKGIIL